VKGSEFQTGKDRTGAIPLEEQTVAAVGGKMAFTDDLTFSASNLVNRHFPVFPKEVSNYLAGYAARHGTERTLRYLANIGPLKVLVVGEAIIDEYCYCEAIGQSSKEPTLAVKYLNAERFAGGILAVANHIANFADQVTVVSFLGAENSYEDFIQEKLHGKIEKYFLRRAHSPTIVKRRFVEKYFFTKLF